ncbi:MAG: hypothetical protein IPK60_24880 [Sandaracinaceae bacterium]|nr:hypothetical protein [Sandaracinaceae bacterium]
MSKRVSQRPAEFARLESESGFTPILRELFRSSRHIISVTFVDSQSECIDYCSSLAPYDAKIAGAQLLITLSGIQDEEQRLRHGETFLVHISGDTKELVVCRVGPEHVLAVVLEPESAAPDFFDSLERAIRDLRIESGLERRTAIEALLVGVRRARGWPYAPTSFMEDGIAVDIVGVLGRWVERAADGAELVCFRVRAKGGEELTLVHAPEAGGWTRRGVGIP